MTKLNVTIEQKINKPSEYRFGTFFLDTKYNTVYILARVGCDVACLIGLDGNRFVEPMPIRGAADHGVALRDFIKLIGCGVDRFVPLENVEVKVW